MFYVLHIYVIMENKQLEKMEGWLKSKHPENVMMPLKRGERIEATGAQARQRGVDVGKVRKAAAGSARESRSGRVVKDAVRVGL